MSDIVYLKLEKISLVKDKMVYLEQVAKLWCSNKDLEQRCRRVNILNIQEDSDKRCRILASWSSVRRTTRTSITATPSQR